MKIQVLRLAIAMPASESVDRLREVIRAHCSGAVAIHEMYEIAGEDLYDEACDASLDMQGVREECINEDLIDAIKPLVAIADAYDLNALDDEARKRWGKDENQTPPEQIELYKGRGGKRLLTLEDCFKARRLVAKALWKDKAK